MRLHGGEAKQRRPAQAAFIVTADWLTLNLAASYAPPNVCASRLQCVFFLPEKGGAYVLPVCSPLFPQSYELLRPSAGLGGALLVLQ
jgi:hypothetical protein